MKKYHTFPINRKHERCIDFLTIIVLTVLMLLSACSPKHEMTFPKKEWGYSKDPEVLGWNEKNLEKFRKYLELKTEFTGLMIIHKGEVVFQYGNVEETSYIASCRKSILAILYGEHVENGKINLEATLNDLEIDDIQILLDLEKQAKVKDLLAARSGVFHPASNGGDLRRYAPERGTVKPGSFWLYNNWDFNLAGFIFEKQSNTKIYDEIERQLVIPLQIQDWNRSIQRFTGDSTASNFMAYHMWFSTRDMARIGHMLLNQGKWNDKQVISSSWHAEMIKSRTTYKEAQKNAPLLKEDGLDLGYGYMWWLLQNQKDPRLKGAYSAQGAAGQGITIYPAIETVLAYKTNTDKGKRNSIQIQMEVIKLAGKLYKPID